GCSVEERLVAAAAVFYRGGAIMKSVLLDIAAPLLVLLPITIGAPKSYATIIGPNDFGPQAQIETFDSQSIGNSAGSFVNNGVTYSFPPFGGYQIRLIDLSRPPLALAALQIAVLQAVVSQELLN